MRYRIIVPVSALLLLLLPSTVAAQSAFNWLSEGYPIHYRMGAEFAVTAFVGISLLGLFPDWGQQAVRTARHSTLLSMAVGLPGLFVFVTLWLLSLVLIATVIGMLIGIPLAVFAIVFEIVWGTVGYVAVGTVLGARFGTDNAWLGIFIGALLSALFVPIPYLGTALGVLVAMLGIGASLRVTFGSGGVDSRERTAPPAHRT
ncbi:hypothetical protein [Halopiger djelfimassiliensis]|uniref:hypothetical protein n=1 Tax=Halopiger djelfimassiliensis TaxID=1293047 RepID=UPI00067796C3|nr:hypothetical protein [Halopiger djelfimassiliensis]